MSEDYMGKIQRVFGMIEQSKGLKSKKDLAYKQADVAEAEFQVVLDNRDSTKEQIETARQKVVATFEAYLDTILSLRDFSLSANKELDEGISQLKDLKP